MNFVQMLQALRSINPTMANMVEGKLQAHVDAIGAALPVEQRYFVLGQAGALEGFLKTEAGQSATRAFVAAWVEHANQKS